jgi:soluble lytic murein transglycosylase-like protein
MNQKKWKRIAYFLGAAVIIFSWMVFHMAIRHQSDKNKILELCERINTIEKHSEQRDKDIENMNYLQYRDRATRKKFPVFSKIVKVVYEKSRAYGFNPNLILSLIQIESNFNPNAVSSKGAYGLMQVNYSVWKEELDINNLKIFNIEYNVELGLKILRRYFEKSRGNLLAALHLYNNGYLHNNQKYKHQVVSSIFY